MMKKTALLIFITALFHMVASVYIFAEDMPGKKASSPILQTPSQIEHFLRLDQMYPFSHHEMFLETAKDVLDKNVRELRLKDAVDLGIENHLLSKLATEKVDEALGKRLQSLSKLLPDVQSSVYQRRTFKENLDAQGLKGYGVIGPFNTFDGRIQLMQKVLDLTALSNFQAGIRDVHAARYETEFVRQKVVLLVSLDYLEALRSQGDFKAAEANVTLSLKLLKQAKDQFQAGLANNVDVARAETRLAQDEFRLARLRTDVHEAYLELQRATGLPYEGLVRLMNSLGFIRENVPELADALVLAKQNRLDIKVSQERLEAGQYRLQGAKMKLLPQLELFGDYGSSGNEWNKKDHMTESIMLQATMPVFDGGKIFGEIKESDSQKKQLQIYDDDLRRQVEEDVQKSLWLMDTVMDQVLAASRVVGLAWHELELAQDRFSKGIGDNVELINAQTSLEDARDQYVIALTQYHAARINLYFALGQTDTFYLLDVINKDSVKKKEA
ncbi:MAG: TolC family protein [Candidatus Omnitrophica bacterium]|nr:TolC family protein [Candidatus Omnitrophota bacterium]